MKENKNKGLNISVKSFVTAIVILFVLMVLTYGLTCLIPGGKLPLWKWALSPILVLGAEGSGSLIAIIAFLLILGGVFNGLDRCGLMKYMLDKITARFGNSKYRLLAVVTLFFMAMGSFIGSFEECVPLVPIVVALAIKLGWDALVGIGMSLLAAGCGFAAGICNPFTIGVAQQLAGLPMFSGMWYRVLSFGLIYALLITFLCGYARKIEKQPVDKTDDKQFIADKRTDKALICFVFIVGIGIALILSSVFVTVLQDYTIIIAALMFLVAGVSATLLAGTGVKVLVADFWNGLISVLPAVLMILMANAIKYTMTEGGLLNVILNGAVDIAAALPKWAVILFIYMITLGMNFFIPSGSAKAFLMMPLIVPVAQVFGISAQLCVLAYAFGDGFSNAFYPTNPVLLISLGLADVNYGTWAKWSGKFQLMNLALTSGLLLVGLVIGYC
ncbi:MAG: YfcC family protein [Lachnospiraceae bacterium]|nr:YfcC family protein [Lachnospiraceae bacterium]